MIIFVEIFLYSSIILIGALGLFAYKNANKIIAKFKNRKQVETDPEWEGLIRKDFNKWDQKKIKIGCFLKFPFRLLGLLISVFGMTFIVLLTGKIQFIAIKAQIWFLNNVAKRALSLIISINEDQAREKISSPIIISNHVCWIDIPYLMFKLYPMSFLAHQGVAKIPLIGMLCRYTQCLFLARQNASERNAIQQQILQRVEKYNNGTPNTNPLLLFPQGTTSNGRSLLRFKIGAFAPMSKITILGLIYDCQGFDMGMEQVSSFQHLIISLCLSPRLIVKQTSIEPQPNQSPNNYMTRCQEKLRELTGFRICNAGLTEKKALIELRKDKNA